MSLIYLGSPVAFNAIISLAIVALMATYGISIGCVLWRRIALPHTLPPVFWSLGKWGLAVNGLGLTYAIFSFFWAFWPIYWQPTAEEVSDVFENLVLERHHADMWYLDELCDRHFCWCDVAVCCQLYFQRSSHLFGTGSDVRGSERRVSGATRGTEPDMFSQFFRGYRGIFEESGYEVTS